MSGNHPLQTHTARLRSAARAGDRYGTAEAPGRAALLDDQGLAPVRKGRSGRPADGKVDRVGAVDRHRRPLAHQAHGETGATALISADGITIADAD